MHYNLIDAIIDNMIAQNKINITDDKRNKDFMISS